MPSLSQAFSRTSSSPPPPPPASRGLTLDRDPVDNWQRYEAAGHRIGPPSAAITIVEFSDFECPFCRRFALSLWPGVRASFPDDVALIYRHYPLTYHAQARPAAIAAECAAAQGHFEAFHDAVFAFQDSLGAIPWATMATRAGLSDTSAFVACLSTPTPADAVERDLRSAKELGATGTPTLLINGRLLRGAPDSAAFHKLISDALAKRP